MINNMIHYMIQDPKANNGLIYPSELTDDEFSVGLGEFYILGEYNDETLNHYLFPAIYKQETIITNLIRSRSNKSYFRVVVPNIGSFSFLVESVYHDLNYSGAKCNFKVNAKLSILNVKKINIACINHDFYFIGYSPNLYSYNQNEL